MASSSKVSKKKQDPTCDICCEKLNKSDHKPVECCYCNIVYCRACIQRYLKESTQDAHCMGCRKAFTRDFLVDACTNVFLTTEYKKNR